MSHSTRLGAFKILKDIVWVSVTRPREERDSPAVFSRALADGKINLPFITTINGPGTWRLNVAVDAQDVKAACSLLEHDFGKIDPATKKGGILSIFPHKDNPEIMGILLDILGNLGAPPSVLANSHSAISVVLHEQAVNKASNALFGPFRFSAYRTPDDWKLAQKGREDLYKEVVASYQEKRPKVYFLEWRQGQTLLKVLLDCSDMGRMGSVFMDFSRMRLPLTFMVSNPLDLQGKVELFFCLPTSFDRDYREIITKAVPGAVPGEVSPVAIFSMNGPHFGDRYGIACELLEALALVQVEPLALSCSIASITGVVPADQIHSAIRGIRGCFEVPSVIQRT